MIEELVVRAMLRDELSAPLVRTRREVRETTREIQRMGAESETAGRRAGTMGLGLRRMGVGIAATGLLVAGASVKMAGDFQQATNVLVTAAGENAAGLAQVRAGIRSIATETGTSFKQLEAGSYTLEKAGYRGANAVKVLRAAAQGAREENASLASVTNAMTSVMASYHLGPDRAVQVMNALKTGAGQAKVTMEDFAASLSTVIPIASAAGISLSDVFGAFGTLTQHGTSAQESTQELGATIRGLVKMNRPQMAELNQLGLDPSDISGNIGKRGLTGTLDVINAAILHHMTGPGGRVALSAFNQSRSARSDADIMIANLAPNLQALARNYQAGKITLKDWRADLKGLSTPDASLLSQFAVVQNKAQGFNQFIRSGDPAAQVYTGALARAMGTSIGMNTALQLVGANSAGTHARAAAVQRSLDDPSKQVEGWASTQKLLNVELDRGARYAQSLGIGIGTALIPKVIDAANQSIAWAKQSRMLHGDVDAVRSVVHDAGVIFSRDFLPPLKILVGLSFVTLSVGLHALAGAIGFIAGHPAVGAILVGIAAGMVAMKVVVGGAALINGLRYFVVGLRAVAATEGVVGVLRALTVGMLGLDTAMDANPIGLVIAALVALGVGLTYAWKHSETFRDITIGAVKLVGKAFLTYVDGVLWGMEQILRAASHLPKWLGGGIASAALGEIEKMRRGIQGMKDDLDRLGAKPVVISIQAQVHGVAKQVFADTLKRSGSVSAASHDAAVIHGVGDTAGPRVAGGNFARTMAFHAAMAGPGVKISNAFVGGGGFGFGSGEHQAGKALDLVGPGLPGYAARARRAGAFAEFHGNGPGRHLHVAVGDTPGPRAGADSDSGGGVIMLTVQQTIEVTKAMPTEADVTAAAAQGLIDATKALAAVGYTVVPGGRGDAAL